MNWSKYNFLFKSKNNNLFIFNSLSNYFAELDEETFLELKKIEGKKKIETLNFDKDQLIFFKEKKILVDSDVDEYYKIKLQTGLKRYINSGLALTIAPTNDCNFTCSYCYEKNRLPIYMNEDTENNLINFIKGYKNLNGIFITWYGGEPLLNFKSIKSITEKIKTLNIPFSAMIVTNGYLLTEEKLTEFKYLNIKNIQITIDGDNNTHNERRHLKNGQGTFDKIIENIKSFYRLDLQKDISISIRVNIDEANRNTFPLICDFFNKMSESGKFSNLKIYPAFVDDVNVTEVDPNDNDINSCIDTKSCLFDRKKIIEYYKDLLNNNKITTFSFYPDMGRMECIARNSNGFVIGADGAVYKCWNDIGIKEKEVLNVNEKGIKNENVLARYLTGADPFDDKQCQDCNILPICSGGCPYNRIENLLIKENNNYQNLCSLFKDNVEDFLETHYYIENSDNKVNVDIK